MTGDPVQLLARKLVDLTRRMEAQERSARLQFSTVGVTTSEDDDAPVVDLDVSGALFTGVEASVDAMAAQQTANAAARTFRQPDPPTPANQPDGIIPEGSLWTDTDSDNRQYRWTGGVWVEQPLGQGALDATLVALITMRFATEAQRDTLLPAPEEGMRAYVVGTNLEYQYASGVWVPLLQYVKKMGNQTVPDDTLTADTYLWANLVPGSYRVEAFLHMSGPSAGNVKIAWTYSGTVVTGNRTAQGMGRDQSSAYSTQMRTTGHSYATSVIYGTQSDDTSAVTEDILLVVSTPGRLQMFFAQATDSSGSVTMSSASRLYISKVS